PIVAVSPGKEPNIKPNNTPNIINNKFCHSKIDIKLLNITSNMLLTSFRSLYYGKLIYIISSKINVIRIISPNIIKYIYHLRTDRTHIIKNKLIIEAGIKLIYS